MKFLFYLCIAIYLINAGLCVGLHQWSELSAWVCAILMSLNALIWYTRYQKDIKK